MKPTVSIYVDAQNLYHAARAAGDLVGMDLARPDYEGILTEAIQASADLLGCDEWKQVEVLHQRIYSASRNRTTAFDNALSRLGYEVNSYILRSESDSFDWDVPIAVDMLRDIAALDSSERHAVVIVTGDGDFAYCLEAIEEDHEVPCLALGYKGSTSARFKRVSHLTPGTLYVGH